MKKLVLTLPLSLLLVFCFGQTQRKIYAYFQSEFNKTINDATIGNNPWGIGVGLNTFYNNKTKFKPLLEFTADVYLADDDVYRIYSDGTELPEVTGMFNLFTGVSYHPAKDGYFSFEGGPSFINGKTYFGLKPTIAIYSSKKQLWVWKMSYLNILNRDKRSKQDFVSWSLSVGVKLF